MLNVYISSASVSVVNVHVNVGVEVANDHAKESSIKTPFHQLTFLNQWRS